jgi:hypothetical protein
MRFKGVSVRYKLGAKEVYEYLYWAKEGMCLMMERISLDLAQKVMVGRWYMRFFCTLRCSKAG